MDQEKWINIIYIVASIGAMNLGIDLLLLSNNITITIVGIVVLFVGSGGIADGINVAIKYCIKDRYKNMKSVYKAIK